MQSINEDSKTRHPDEESQSAMRVAGKSLLEDIVSREKQLLSLQTQRLSILDSMSARPAFEAGILSIDDNKHYLAMLQRTVSQLEKLNTTMTTLRDKPTELTSFRRLPSELRLKIWTFASKEYLRPRALCIKIERACGYGTSDPQRKHWRFSILGHSIPAIVHACREARAQFIHATGTEFRFGTYINRERDLIYYGCWFRTSNSRSIETANDREYRSFLSFLEQPDAKIIRRLALPLQIFTRLPGHDGLLSMRHLEMRRAMPRCEEVAVVSHRVTGDDWSPSYVAAFWGTNVRQVQIHPETEKVLQLVEKVQTMAEGSGLQKLEYQLGALQRDLSY